MKRSLIALILLNLSCLILHAKLRITAYPIQGSKKAIIICPGGSYFWHDIDTEGHEVAAWLNKHNISAFVLKYRTAGKFAFVSHHRYILRGHRYPDAQNDLKAAIDYVKAYAAQYDIDPDSIGLMGFSAGGHLVMSAHNLLDKQYRPAFIAPIYPVVTMSESCTHKRSRRALMGESRKRNKSLRNELSLEKHIGQDCPPVFLVNCKDDPIVDYHNSELLDSALTEAHIDHLYIQYQTGGHGFGASDTKGTAECRAWKQEFIHWLSTH